MLCMLVDIWEFNWNLMNYFSTRGKLWKLSRWHYSYSFLINYNQGKDRITQKKSLKHLEFQEFFRKPVKMWIETSSANFFAIKTFQFWPQKFPNLKILLKRSKNSWKQNSRCSSVYWFWQMMKRILILLDDSTGKRERKLFLLQ